MAEITKAASTVTLRIENLQELVKPDYSLDESERLHNDWEGKEQAGEISGVAPFLPIEHG